MARILVPPKVYSLADVMRLTGAKRPQIEYWVRKHVVRGEFESGTGLPRQFVFRNLVEVSIAVQLTTLGINTETAYAIINQLRYGDVESDIRTPWFAEAVPGGPRRQRRLSREEARRQYKRWQKQADADPTPREDRCCAELNDDGTLKLLKLLRAYVDAGVSDEEIRKGLLGVAREHVREHREWQKDNEALHRRWRAFKNPVTRPKTGDFWIVCDALEQSEERGLWRRVRLTHNREKDRETASLGDAAIIIAVRSTLQRLEKSTGDSWRATTEKHIYRPDEFMPTPRDLVAQAFREYEKTEERREQALTAVLVNKDRPDAIA
jgi:hypothetical protein